MASLNSTTCNVITVCAVTSFAFIAQHTYKFDKWRCLLPRRKEWFRVLLTWMLILCNLGILIWGLGWTYVKYQLGFVTLPDYGAVPVPPQLYPARFRHWDTGLTIMLNLSYALQTSLNAEEGLYWYHLMRAVRRPNSARNWLRSYFFYGWITISIITPTIQFGVTWISPPKDVYLRFGRGQVCGAAIELIVVICACVVVARFPKFLGDVKASGAGPDVRSRLHFYHEANKVRTFFRLAFAISLLLLGIDGCTTAAKINRTPMASDILGMICTSSFFLVLMISVILYLPRARASPNRARIMIAPAATQGPTDTQVTSGRALMSLLREGGQWDDDDDLRAGLSQPKLPSSHRPGPLATINVKGDEWDVDTGELSPVLPIVGNFTSPISIPTEEVRAGRTRIHVQQEIYQDQGGV